MKLNYKHLLLSTMLFYPLSLFATDKPVYLDYDKVNIQFKTELIRVNKGYKTGFIDKQGNRIIDVIYDHIDYFDKDGLAVAVKDKKSGLINKKGEIVVPFEYDAIDRNEKNNSYKILINNQWGVVDKAFKPIIPTEYEEIIVQNSGYILYKDSLYKLADADGNIITPSGFDQIECFADNTVMVRIEGRWHFFDTQTKQVDKVAYDKVKPLQEDFLLVRQKGEFSIINAKTNKVVVPFGYNHKSFVGQDLITVKKDNKIGLFNFKGEMVLAPTYDAIGYFSRDTTADVRQGDLAGRINTKGELVTPMQYIPDMAYNSNGYDVQQSVDKKWHILTRKEGKEIGWKSGVDKVYFVGEKYFAIKDKGKNYLVDIRPPYKIFTTLDRYDAIKGHYCGDCYNGNMIVTKNGKYGFINSQGKELIKPIYDQLLSWTTANLLFKKGNKYGVVDFNGKVEVEAKYDKLEWLDCYSESRGLAYLGDKWQLIDIHSQPVSPLFDTKLVSIISSMESLVVKDQKTGLYGLFDFDGNEVIPAKYTRVMAGKTIIEVTQQEEIALFNKQGKQITPFKSKTEFRGYDYSTENNIVIIHYLVGRELYWTIYDIATGKALYTNEKLQDESPNP
ncbi:WG repeat-containing protein [Pasteurella atlantica]|uniref:WG repeat-containing protein n=1 Tax=Pasteurellaceae TaxID=712 RepID=UPI00276C12FA|nr:WG repeat-containing protein [Pasteurella atlantica]MDP8034383.1 WG repeat-containing protein [Pasteurella atlantica]MDP8036308.1 WG repeat-containing protein [Pasteurella atlantica]MDP8038266.1 WG repeat-containing protein [Pasteurella atlantica]MDP8048619.1 WG repeat-containing protein [Pasteurella atlantica]MDP8050570.1 WG repeat-containing protein [Pasteurella atlantica]